MKHYVCTECGMESKSARLCDTDSCLLQGTPLKECTCEDGMHDAIKSDESHDSDEETDQEDMSENSNSQDTTTLDLDSDLS